MPESISPSDNEKKWQTEDDARTLVKAEEIKSDKTRLKAALALLKEQSKNTQKAIGES